MHRPMGVTSCFPSSVWQKQTSPRHVRCTQAHTHMSLLDTYICQTTMWTPQTECWWEQTLHHYTHFTHYTSNFCYFGRLYPYTFILSFPFLSSWLSLARSFWHIYSSLLPLSVQQRWSLEDRCHHAVKWTSQWGWIKLIRQTVHLQNPSADNG